MCVCVFFYTIYVSVQNKTCVTLSSSHLKHKHLQFKILRLYIVFYGKYELATCNPLRDLFSYSSYAILTYVLIYSFTKHNSTKHQTKRIYLTPYYKVCTTCCMLVSQMSCF